MQNYFSKFLIPILALTLILACAPFAASTPQPAATLNALYTSAAETLAAMSTQGAYTLTAQPLVTETLSFPGSVTATVFPTYTTVPPIQPIVTRCDAAAFVSDVTYPDGTAVALGSAFTKIWRIRNTGTCSWNSSYSLVFVGGEKLSGPNAVAVPGNVAPGQSIDIAVNLTAPSKGGSYVGYWKLRNPAGVLFGMGAGDASVYVDIKVAGYNIAAYDFLASYCDANWRNDGGDLPCPGTQSDDRGFVVALNSPKMENGKSIGNGLLTYPQQKRDGMISGKYPGFDVEAGDRFQATIGCKEDADDCDVVFRLQYQIGKGDIKTIGQWREVYEGGSYPINIDLSFLDGERVKFILSVIANGSDHEDFAIWVNPRITRQSSKPPTATFTPSVTPTGSVTPTPTFTPTATSTPTATLTATPTSTVTATTGP